MTIFVILTNYMDFNNFNFKNNQLIIAGAVVIGVLIVGVGGFLYFQSQKTSEQTVPPGSQAEVTQVVEEVGKLMDLPIGEVPTVATVTDVTQLQGQAFFARAKNGDKVLIYQNAQKAILYDQKAKRIIEVAPINLGTPSAQVASPSATPAF